MFHDREDDMFLLRDWLPGLVPGALADRLTWSAGLQQDVQALHRRYCDIAVLLDSSYVAADREGVALTAQGRVQIPPSIERLWPSVQSALARSEADLQQLDAPGAWLARHARQCVTEMLLAANPAFLGYGGFTGMALPIIAQSGTPAQRDIYLPKLRDGLWDACFCVTEAQAGSDLNAIITHATPLADAGEYAVRGTKVYITAGMHDLTENTVHLLLARTRPDVPLSCLLVPRFWPQPDGSLRDNHVRCIKVDDKMGLRGCATTHLRFGHDGETRATALGGREGIGLVQVAPLMAQARATTALFGTAIARRAYYAALTYARARVQGRPLDLPDSVRPPTIVAHADVQRMLLEMKAKTEAFRGMIAVLNGHLTVVQHAAALQADAAAVARSRVLSQFYVPLLKAYVSDQAWRVCELAIQVHGGAGYLREHVVEQCARDVKVLSLWEGTNYIQALDLLREKLRFGRNSQIWQAFQDDMTAYLEIADAAGAFGPEVAAIRSAHEALSRIVAALPAQVATHGLETVAQFATRILECFGELCAARALLTAATAAARRLAGSLPPAHASRMHGKIDACRFFIFNVLPMLHARAGIIAGMARSGLLPGQAALGGDIMEGEQACAA